ncbi:hypothetical protein [Alkalitalea saponilacus]|uniref:DNA polymerase-3 subunit gamma/tau n=1 Tax=Alkalitalea saponilacus TaxID=889453 RepID=A0A1T5DCA1_9BACT|nr:hypothetical protein [Alkalitalea saponilacus]ASB50659.1 hypothetical protein CDL62_16635 [Alkalitalea saponilacus]SKB69319.1 DNA polymerase-3 subunit gamma/tau [Alkalitalea saponilacus]
MFTILNNHLPQIEKDHTIHLELSSPVQEVEIEKNRDSIMLFLKKELHNSLLSLKVKVAEDQASPQEKVFTAADKLKVMMEKNPALAMLKQQFNLDLD